MVVSNVDRDPIEQLAEEFIRRRRIGEKVSIAEYAQNHPQWAERIHELFPAILWMEEWKPEADRPPSAAGFELGTPVHALKRLGDYRIVRELGRGGMGVVYEAEQESLGRRVALKVLPAAALLSPNRLRRFHREARAAARLHHTNIVPIFGVGEQDGLHYYVMQLIPGQGLDRVLAAMEPLPKDALTGESIATTSCDGSDAAAEPVSASEVARRLLAGRFAPQVDVSAAPDAEETVRLPRPFRLGADSPYWQTVAHIGLQTADALSYAHQRGTLHRDIKPANLLLDAKGTVWVADFGLAKPAEPEELTHSGDVVGTLRYMAPEQFEGRADARSDVYGLGLSLYEMLTLRPAFDGPHPSHTGQDRKEPPRPRRVNRAIPRDLETVVLKAIAPDPDHRYQTAGELADDLKRFLEDRPVLARRTLPPVRLWRWCRRNRAVAALTGTALALLAAVAVVASIGYFHVSRAGPGLGGAIPGRCGTTTGGGRTHSNRRGAPARRGQPRPGHSGIRGSLRKNRRRAVCPARRRGRPVGRGEHRDGQGCGLVGKHAQVLRSVRPEKRGVRFSARARPPGPIAGWAISKSASANPKKRRPPIAAP